jgi:ATP phosphoribosyltransferase regulatory subunit
MLLDVLDRIGVPEFYVHLGCRSLFDACFSGAADDDRRRARRGVRLRDWKALRAVLSEAGREKAAIDALSELFAFIGTVAELDELLGGISRRLTEAERAAVSQTRELCNLLGDLDAGARVRIDFSEIGNQPYHTGVAFQVYMDGLDSAVAAGGRYDGLLSVFGLDAPSVGFSLMLRKIQDQLQLDHELFQAPGAETASGSTFAERVRAARRMRAEGRTTIL